MKRYHKKTLSVLLRLLLVMSLLFSIAAHPVSAAAVNLLGVMDAHAYKNDAVAADTVLPYRIYLPDALSPYFPAGADNASPTEEDGEGEDENDAAAAQPAADIPGDTAYGLLIWLHDEDCRGDDNVAQISDDAKNGLIYAFLTDSARAKDTIVLAPQCPAGTTWTDNGNALLALLIDLVRNQLTQLPIDANRILIAGISMGAEAGYELIAMQADAGALPIAAAYLVAGTTDNTVTDEEAASVYKNTEIYAFLSENDTVTPPDSVRSLVDTLNGTYGCTFRYAVYPEVGHEIWHQAFAEQDLMNAFLSVNAPADAVPETTDIAETETTADTEAETDAETAAPVTTERPEETEAVNGPLSIAGFTITPDIIAYVILSAACILAFILLLWGLVKNNRVR
ncbi:MAG: hypothetical protein ACI3XM_06210 [Eubacteriales bacterium]